MHRAALTAAAVVFVVASACAGPPVCNSDADCLTSELCVAGACAVIVDAPQAPTLVAVRASLSTLEDTIGTVSLGVLDTGDTGAPIDFVLQLPATLGNAVVDGAVLTYTPSAETSGAETLTYAPLCDGELGRPAHVDVDIRAVDDGPLLSVAGPQADGNVAGAFLFDASATDREQQTIEFSAQFASGSTEVRPSDDGIAVIAYAAADGFHGNDTGVITATDAGGAFASLAVSVDVP